MSFKSFRVAAFAAASAVAFFGQQFQDQTAARLPIQNIWSEEVDAGDVDGDGDLDLIYAKGNGFSTASTPRQNTLLINNGSGVFTDQTATRLPAFLDNSKDVDFVDVDGDGDLDIVVANAFGQQPRLYLNNGLGFFTDATAASFPVMLLNSFSSTAGDVDGDGDLDLVFTDSGASTFGSPGGQTRLLLNDGSGVFTNVTAARLPSVLVVAAVDADFADVDGDFDLDLIVVSRDGTPSKLFLNDGTGHFTSGVLPADGTGTYEYEIGDLDGDLDADIFVIGQNGLAEATFVNGGAGNYSIGAGTVIGNVSSDDNDAALGDIDGDGDFDCIVAALSTAERVFVNNGLGVFTYNASLITSFVDSSMDGEFADVDNDGDLDYLSAVGESGAFQNRLYINTSSTASDAVAPVFRLPVLVGAAVSIGDVKIRVGIKDVMTTDGDPDFQSVLLQYVVNGVPGAAAMKWVGRDLFQGVIPGVPYAAATSFTVACIDRAGNLGISAPVAFSPLLLPPVALDVATSGAGDVVVSISAPTQAFVEEFLLVSLLTSTPLGSGPLIGLGPDALAFLFLEIGDPPFHDFLDAAGQMVVSYGPGTLPLGLTLDARAITMNPIFGPQLSNIVRRTF